MMRPMPPSSDDPFEKSATEADLAESCAMCGRPLGWDGQPPARDGDAWICGDCDAARNFEALDL